MRVFVKRPLFIFIAVLLISCAPDVTNPDNLPVSNKLQVWVDAPLDGTTLILPIQYTLVCHGADASSVQAIEFSANGQALAMQTNTETETTLFNASHRWTPNLPGVYNIECRAQNIAGEWSGYASVRVTVTEKIVTHTPTPTASTTPTPTLTHTPTATFTLTSTPSAATITFTSQVSTGAFEYQRDCVPNPGEVTITATLSNTTGVKYIFIFFRLESNALGVTTEWNSGLPMIATRGGGYTRKISWRDISQLSRITGSEANFAYQFVAVGQDNENIARSQVYRDVKIGPCQ